MVAAPDTRPPPARKHPPPVEIGHAPPPEAAGAREGGGTPWWVHTVNLLIVVAFGVVAIVFRTDPRLAGVVAVMVCAALRWSGPWPTVTFGGKGED